MSHWLTNRGKLALMQGQWDDAGATALKMELLAGASVPTGIDTAAEVADLNTVTELLAAAGTPARPVGGWYVRKDLSRTNAAEDDTNDRVNMDTANVTWTAATGGETIYGAFWIDATTDTNDTTRLLMGVIIFASAVPTNGSDLTMTITDLVRAS
jgi:hypothetical protein